MPRRLLACLCVPALVCLPIVSWAAPPSPSPVPVTGPALVIDGTGAAHGMGLAMDGVLGQSRAGWPYRKTLSLFYPGTKPSKFGGTVRVGLGTAAEHAVALPAGGTVKDDSGAVNLSAPAGSTVYVRYEGGYRVRIPGVVGAAQIQESPEPLLPSPPPAPVPTPSPTAAPTPSSQTVGEGSIWITPTSVSQPAVTGRRYRGRMQIRLTQGLWAINHVDMETYVRGIAEEKGAGWPVEGLKVLAVAARSLAAASTTWYGKNQPNGFDICATSNCQVYLGADGEESSMAQAVAATTGEILTHAGRPILAMYHGNGGGRTESYRLLYGDGVSDPHPYLASVEYPFANPKPWQRALGIAEATAQLRAGGIAIPGTLTGAEITSRGMSPRVRTIKLTGTAGTIETTGLRFQGALGLPSAWFDVRVGSAAPIVLQAAAPIDPVPREPQALALPAGVVPEPSRRLPLVALTLALAAAAASAVRASGGRGWSARDRANIDT